jgi:hypothetical protein
VKGRIEAIGRGSTTPHPDGLVKRPIDKQSLRLKSGAEIKSKPFGNSYVPIEKLELQVVKQATF